MPRRDVAAARSLNRVALDENELLDVDEQEELIEGYKRKSKAQERAARLAFGVVCYLLTIFWAGLSALMWFERFSLPPLRRLATERPLLGGHLLQSLTQLLYSCAFAIAARALRDLRAAPSRSLATIIVPPAVYWAILSLILDMGSNLRASLILSLGPVLLMLTIIYVDRELNSLVSEVTKLEALRYDFRKA